MGHRHTKDDLLDGALATAFDHGLNRLTYGRVARRLGINDRMVVYYFPTKVDLVSEVLRALGSRLRTTLAPAFTTPATDHVELLRTAWPILARPDADPVFALYFEATGLAAAGHAPYDTVVPELVEAWIAWVGGLLHGEPDRRRGEAEAAVAVVDGLLLVRHLAGPGPADRAARVLGLR